MVDGWEARQGGYTRTLAVLRQVQAELDELFPPQERQPQVQQQQQGMKPPSSPTAAAPASSSSSNHHNQQHQIPEPPGPQQQQQQHRVRVMLLCGADLLATMAVPGVWTDPDALLREHGVVCVAREGTDLEGLFADGGGSPDRGTGNGMTNVLRDNREHVIFVRDPVPNSLSSTRVRGELEAGRSAAGLVPRGVLRYIREHGLYAAGSGGGGGSEESSAAARA